MALSGSAWLHCPGRPLSVAPTHPAPARLELQTLRWVPRPTLDPELQLESQSVPPLVSCPRCLCLPYANYEQATSHAPPKLNLDAQISTCPTKRLCPRLWHRFRLLSSDLRESQTAQHWGIGRRRWRGKGLPYRILTHGRLSRSRCLQCMWSTLGCVVIHSF